MFHVKWYFLYNIITSVKCAVGTSDPFSIHVGIHQGSALSPLLFTLVMNTITTDVQSTLLGLIYYAEISRLVLKYETFFLLKIYQK